MPVINVHESRQAGVISELMETWRQQMPIFEKQQQLLCRFLKFTKIRKAAYPFKESVPFPKYWGYGMTRTYQVFRDRVIELGIVPYELTIPWNAFDEEDDLLGDTRTHVQGAVKRFGQLPDVLLSEYINGIADLNPTLYNAYDGASLFSATDGNGNDRLGVSGGNIVTGSGLTVAGVIHDYHVVQRRMMQWLDPTASKPIFSPDEAQYSNLAAIGPLAANEVFKKAAKGEFLKTDAGNITSETNIIKGEFEFHLNPYLTDSSDWYVVLKHPYLKAFAYRAPRDVKTIIADINNSDKARETNEYSVYSHVRTRLGVWFPGVIVKVNN